MLVLHLHALPSPDSDRRSDQRHPGTGLSAEVGARLFPVINISTGGMLVAGAALPRHETVRIRLVGPGLPAEGVPADCVVVRSGTEGTALQFDVRTFPLMQGIVRHVARLVGHAPHVF